MIGRRGLLSGGLLALLTKLVPTADSRSEVLDGWIISPSTVAESQTFHLHVPDGYRLDAHNTETVNFARDGKVASVIRGSGCGHVRMYIGGECVFDSDNFEPFGARA